MPFASDYLGYPVWLPQPRNQLDHGLQGYGEAIGRVWEPVELVAHASPNQLLAFEVLALDRAERWEIEEHFRDMRGREGLFWIPGYKGIMRLSTQADMDATAIQIVDSLEGFGLNMIRRHVWLADREEAYEVANPSNASPGVLELDVHPALASDIAAGFEPWALYLVRFASDSLDMRAVGNAIHEDGAGETHEIAQARLSFVESQGNTPTNWS